MNRQRMLVALLATVAGLCLGLSSPAFGAPAWRIDALANSTVAPGGTLDYFVKAVNVGDTAMDGSQITVGATLASGMVVVSARLGSQRCFDGRDGTSTVVGATSLVCFTTDRLAVGGLEPLSLRVSSTATSGTLTTTFTVTGGGAPSVTSADPTQASSTPPPFGVAAFDGGLFDASGQPDTQAGGHPYSAGVSIDFNTLTNPIPILGELWPVEIVKDVHTNLPPGLVGNPTAVAQCTLPELSNSSGFVGRPLCPPESQVGTTLVRVKGLQGGADNQVIGPLPVFNLVPAPGVPAQFGFNVFGSVIVLDGTVRPGDFGVSVNAINVPEALAIIGTDVTLWGDPASPSHTPERACAGRDYPADGGPTCASQAPEKPFLRGSTECTTPDNLQTSVQVDSWQHPGAFTPPVSFELHHSPGYPWPREDWGAPIGTTGCDAVPFDPALSGRPDPGAQAGTPSGFSFDLSLPQPEDVNSPGESDLKKAVVTLPLGVRVSPSSANGLDACSSAEIALDSSSLPTCPNASKLGTVTIDTPLLKQQATGAIYLATPFDNKFDSLVAVYLVASVDGVVLKIAGQASMDPNTGQITTTFDDNPQLPFTRLHLQFKGGPRAPLTLPSQCGTYTTVAQLTGWNGRTVESDSSFTVSQDENGQPCPPRFTPSFDAGTDSNIGGSSASFLLRFARQDGDQDVAGLTVNLPDGLTGKIAAAQQCSDAQAVAGTCPAASKIGDVTVGAGQGIDPFFITNGQAFLTGPYKGAPFGVSIVVPAVAGPFNLGDVVVRSALFVDRKTADVTIVSDPLPTIVQGIPLDVRDVRVSVDRPGFFQNPTSCAAKTISGVLTSTAGATANVSQHYQAADCAKLGFEPHMALTVGGKGHTKAGQTTPLSTTVTMPAGDANLRFVRVTLPTTINARLTVINNACTQQQFDTNLAACAHAKAGTATAVTPLLSSPLTGAAYFVRSHPGFPDLDIALRGQVAFDLVGRISVPDSKYLATTFDAIPDVPVSSFTLKLFGDSKHGSIGAATNLCTASARAAPALLDYIGQNGRVFQTSEPLKITGCPKPKKKGKARGGRH